MRIELPSTLSEVRIEEYQRLTRILSESNDADIQAYSILSVLTGLSKLELNRLPYITVQDLLNKVVPVFNEEPNKKLIRHFTIDDVEFGFIPNLEEMTFGEYVDLNNYIDAEGYANAHKFMAVCYRPLTEKQGDKYLIEEYNGSSKFQDIMLDAPVDAYLSALLFFSTLGNELLRLSRHYLKEAQSQLARQEAPLQRNGDGTDQSIALQVETLLSTMQLQEWEFYNPLQNLHLKLSKKLY